MARIRSIKPSFFKSDDVSALPMRARLTWIGLWTQCDDQGRTKDHLRLIKADVWPLDDVTLTDIEEDLSTLAAHGRIVRYQVDGQRYLEVANWSKHQKIDRPTKSSYPAPPNGSAPAAEVPRSGAAEPRGTGPEAAPARLSTGTRRTLDEPATSPRPGKGGERKGGEGRGRAREDPTSASGPAPEPPPRCPKHLDTPDPPPCGPCADARRAHDRWELAEAERKRTMPKCPKHRGQPADGCGLCRADHLAAPDPTADTA